MSTIDSRLDTSTTETDEIFTSLGEVGTATFCSMLFCTAAIIAYLKVGRYYLEANVPWSYHLLIVSTLGIITLCTLGCAVHMIFVGDRSSRQLKRDLQKQNDELSRFVIKAKKTIREYEAEALRQAGHVRPSCLDSIGQARRIVNALGKRGDDIRKLLTTRNKYALIDADEMLRQPLVITENCMDSLIGADPVAPVDPEDWIPSVERMFNGIERDLNRIKVAA